MPRVLLILGLILIACDDESPPRSASPGLVNVLPVPPGAVRMTAAQGAQAAVAEYRVPAHRDSIADWYRRWFRAHAWRIVGDTRLADGTVSLHADSQAQPVWLLVRAAAVGTQFAVMVAEAPRPR